MKVKCIITLELDSGDFELKVENVSAPGTPIDYGQLKKVLGRVFEKWDEAQKE